MKKKQWLLLPLLLGVWAFYPLDEDPLQTVLQRLTTYLHTLPQEKVYLHLDKPYYYKGDTLWFKSYLTDAVSHAPDSVSQVVYVDLIQREQGKILAHKLIHSQHGFSYGDFMLADSLPDGLYQIRAYTNWMRNFKEDFFFQQDFRLYAAGSTAATMRKETTTPEVADFQLFPEGGNLVSGLQGRVAFKATDATGHGVQVQGFVLDNSQDTVVQFQSQHLGMGYFFCTPEQGKTYQVYLKTGTGAVQSYPFPTPLPTGFVLFTDNFSSKTNIKLFISQILPEAQSKDVMVVAHQLGNVFYAGKVPITKTTSFLQIPKDRIPDEGLVHITLFDSKGVPQCERLVFHRLAKRIQVAIQPDKPAYETRGKVQLDITVKDAEGKPVQGNFSLAVTDARQVLTEAYPPTIYSYLLLASDMGSLSHTPAIRGLIEKPSSYFDPNDGNASIHLDILLMTQGWRRFLWKDVLQPTLPEPKFMVENGLSVTGKATRLNGSLNKKPVQLTLMVTSKAEGGSIYMNEVPVNSEKFGFYGLYFTDTTSVLVQGVKSTGGKAVDIKLDPVTVPSAGKDAVLYDPLVSFTNTIQTFLKRNEELYRIRKGSRLNQVQVLQEVKVTAKKETPQDTRRMLYGTPDATVKIDPTTCGSVSSIVQFLQGRVAGLMVSGSGPDATVTIRGQEAKFLLDGMSVDASFISSLSPCDVEAIDILKGASASVLGANGVVSILTRRGGVDYDWSKAPALGITTLQRMGYAIPREFYMPHYDQSRPEFIRPDYRSTVFWKPVLTTDAQGKAQVMFWNSDEKTTMHVQLEGLTYTGTPITASYEYAVK